MASLSGSDKAQLRSFRSTTELMAAGGNQTTNAMSLSTGQTVYYYVIGTGPNHEMFWIGVHDKIRKNGEWAIIHDHNSDRYELWTDGTKARTVDQFDDVLEELAESVS